MRFGQRLGFLTALLGVAAVSAAQAPASLNVSTGITFPVMEHSELYRYGIGAQLQARMPLGTGAFYGGDTVGGNPLGRASTGVRFALSAALSRGRVGVSRPRSGADGGNRGSSSPS